MAEQRESYTIRSHKNGKYISSLFSDRHDDMFTASKLEDAYTWNNIVAVRKIALEIGCCTPVKLS